MDAHYDVLSSIIHRFQWLSSAYRQVTYVLLTRSPLRIPKYPPFDLHVLGMPPALILSQDQTLHKIFMFLFFIVPFCSFLFLIRIVCSFLIYVYRSSYIVFKDRFALVLFRTCAHTLYHSLFLLSITFFIFFKKFFYVNFIIKFR